MKINEIERLYHGTDRCFDEFDFHKAKGFKDFGKGYYLTTNFNQALRWAQRKGSRNSKAYVYSYRVECADAENLKILELLKYDLKWLDFISQNRIYGKDTDYDIIYDRMADSQYTDISELLQAYVQKEKTAEEIIERIKWKEGIIANQYCFKNNEALQLLRDKVVYGLEKDKDGIWTIDEGDCDRV